MSASCPSLTAADVTGILGSHYRLQTMNITELVSFDSRNFAVDAVHSNEHSEKETPAAVSNVDETQGESELAPGQKLVLKVFNSGLCTAEKLPTTRQQIVCSQFLRQRGFLCPEVVHTSKGELMAHTSSDKYKLAQSLIYTLSSLSRYLTVTVT